MNGTVAAPASRNAACPCGSGLRYKQCHGLIAASPQAASLDRLALARAKLQAGEHDEAARLCDEVLAQHPGHPVALEIQALREAEVGPAMSSLRTLLRAARGLADHALPPAAAYGIWSALNNAFLDALGGLDAAVARDRRESYRRALLEPRAAAANHDVAVVLVVRTDTSAPALVLSVESILAQSRAPAELVIVVPMGMTMPILAQARLAAARFPVRTVEVAEEDSIASALDSAVAQATATFVVALDPPNAFDPAHLELLVDGIADRAASWGYTDCEPLAPGAVGSDALAARIADSDAQRTAIARADSVGMAFIGPSFAATGLGAVAFARALHAEVGGFRPLPRHEMWDFALRATWVAEPMYVATSTYLHAVTEHAHELSIAQRDSAQRAIFGDYYARACDPDAASPNPFAPSLANWGLTFAQRLFDCGHVLMVSLDQLDALAGQIESALAKTDARAGEDDSGAAKPRAPAAAASFVSHAQHGEDALLAHVLRDVACGRYVDVGANDPDRHSVTRAFYDRGWCGVNVEPAAEWHARLAQARPRDVNLAVAVADTRGTVKFHEYAGTGLSTLDDATAQRHARAGYAANLHDVPAVTLADVFDANADGETHFLKIDVEGAEGRVLAGADFRRHRPWIVLVEATAPLTGIASHADWEPQLLAAGYRFAHDDGLNRYYVSDEHADLAVRFAQDAASRRVIRAAEAIATADDLPPERRFDPRAHPFLDRERPEPTLANPTSQLCTVGQFAEPQYYDWCRALHETPMLHRKQWEFVYIMQVLELAGCLAPGRRGLGFGCGREPLAAAMAMRGCEVVATDLDLGSAAGQGWIETGQHSRTLDDLNDRGICAPELFRERVTFRSQDMNRIDADLTGFDFVWSSCAFEHLGSIRHGLEFVENAMRCLRPGGIAVHTTEFNLSSNGATVESPTLSVFRRRDIERHVRALESQGHRVFPLNLQPGAAPVDRYVDVPPYRAEPHLKLRLSRFVITSFGWVIERGPAQP